MRDWYGDRRDTLIESQEHCPTVPGLAEDASLKQGIGYLDATLNRLGRARDERDIEALARACVALVGNTLDLAIHSGIDLRACMEHGATEGLRVGRPAEREGVTNYIQIEKERPRYEYKIVYTDVIGIDSYAVLETGLNEAGALGYKILKIGDEAVIMEREL